MGERVSIGGARRAISFEEGSVKIHDPPADATEYSIVVRLATDSAHVAVNYAKSSQVSIAKTALLRRLGENCCTLKKGQGLCQGQFRDSPADLFWLK
jgi:hypothetical protein